MKNRKAAFSLTELVVVLSILGALFLVALNIIGFIGKAKTESVRAEINMVQTPVDARLADGGAVAADQTTSFQGTPGSTMAIGRRIYIAADQTTNFRVISRTLGLEPYPRNTSKYYYRRTGDGTVTPYEWRIIRYRTK
ncbi:MAG: prepilin-type N-terminal cleavage/methylation domain-containing protein [Chloroflexota bacterium]